MGVEYAKISGCALNSNMQGRHSWRDGQTAAGLNFYAATGIAPYTRLFVDCCVSVVDLVVIVPHAPRWTAEGTRTRRVNG